jgi:hypothetical protein
LVQEEKKHIPAAITVKRINRDFMAEDWQIS